MMLSFRVSVPTKKKRSLPGASPLRLQAAMIVSGSGGSYQSYRSYSSYLFLPRTFSAVLRMPVIRSLISCSVMRGCMQTLNSRL